MEDTLCTAITGESSCWSTSSHRIILPMPIISGARIKECSLEKEEERGDDSCSNGGSGNTSKNDTTLSSRIATPPSDSTNGSAALKKTTFRQENNSGNNSSSMIHSNRGGAVPLTGGGIVATTKAAKNGGGHKPQIRNRGPHPSETDKRREHPKLQLPSTMAATTPQLSAVAQSPATSVSSGGAKPSPASDASYASSSNKSRGGAGQLLRPRPPLECDYDKTPTRLYKLIEAKQWEKLVDGLEDADEIPALQAETWVVRKEANGRLRWRLLPLHAAIIFNAPHQVVEAILEVYPAAAAAKDDQGMLPLHLCFKNFTGSVDEWQILEELLTHYPAAAKSRDRKGRTPLQGGLLNASCSDNGEENKTCSAALQALQLYSTVVAAGNRSTATASATSATTTTAGGVSGEVPQEVKTATPAQQSQEVAKLQSKHVATLEELRRQFLKERHSLQSQQARAQEELKRQLQASRREQDRLQRELLTARREICSNGATESFPSSPAGLALQEQNQQLRVLLQSVLDDQAAVGTAQRLQASQQQAQADEFRTQFTSICGHHDSPSDRTKDTPSPLTFLRKLDGGDRTNSKMRLNENNLSASAPASLGFAGLEHFLDEKKEGSPNKNESSPGRRGRHQHRRSLADEILDDLDASLDTTSR